MPSKRPNGWLARYRDANGVEHTRLFREDQGAPKRKAIGWEEEHKSAVRRGTDVDPRAGKTLVRDAAETWRIAQVHHRPQTAKQVELVFRLHLVPYLGGRKMATVTKADVQGLVKAWESAGARPATVRQRFVYVKAMFSAAADDGTIARNPCARVKLPEVENPRVEPLSVKQVRALIEALPAWCRPIAVVGAGCGLRVSEVLGLTADRVRFLRRDLVVDRQAASRPPFDLAPLKNSRRSPVRTVPMPAFVADALSVLPAVKASTGRLFVRPDGVLVTAHVVQDTVRAAVTRAGLPAGTTFHDLRHFYASALIEAGENVTVVADRLGDVAAVVLGTYSHLWPDSADRTRTIIDGLFQDHADRVRTGAAPKGR